MSESNLSQELRTTPVEPLLPIEKKLIGWSLGLGHRTPDRPRICDTDGFRTFLEGTCVGRSGRSRLFGLVALASAERGR